jgi:hypothetical protein
MIQSCSKLTRCLWSPGRVLPIIAGFAVICLILVGFPLPSLPVQTPPYPPSPAIEGVIWDFSSMKRLAPGSDLWPITWAADDNLYTSWGDGGGFGGTNRDGRVRLGFARIADFPMKFTAANIWGGKNTTQPATFGGKTAGMLSVGGILYAWINMQNAKTPDIRLAWSLDLAKSWQLADWKFPDPRSPTFFPSTFLNFGKDYAGARDEFVYVYGGQWTWTQGPTDHAYLAHVPREQVRDRNAYEFYRGLDLEGNPRWSQDIALRQPVFTDPNGVANTALCSVVFNPGIGRFLLTVAHRPPGSPVMAGVGQLGIFDAPEPWGPWTTVAYYDDWGGFGNGEALIYALPTKWMSSDGKTFWMVFSSTGKLDSFNLIKGSLIVNR